MSYKSSAILALSLSSSAMAVTYPGVTATDLSAKTESNSFTLENSLLKATWNSDGKQLSGVNLTNKETKQSFNSGKELFAIATQPQAQDPDRVYVGIRKTNSEIQTVISNDGKSWDKLHALPLADFPSKLKAFRVGKISGTGQANDHSSAGEMGSCEFQQVQVTDAAGKVTLPLSQLRLTSPAVKAPR